MRGKRGLLNEAVNRCFLFLIVIDLCALYSPPSRRYRQECQLRCSREEAGRLEEQRLKEHALASLNEAQQEAQRAVEAAHMVLRVDCVKPERGCC